MIRWRYEQFDWQIFYKTEFGYANRIASVLLFSFHIIKGARGFSALIDAKKETCRK